MRKDEIRDRLANITMDLQELLGELAADTGEEDPERVRVIEAFREFILHWPMSTARARDVVTWVQQQRRDDWSDLREFHSAQTLGLWLRMYSHVLKIETGIEYRRFSTQGWMLVLPSKRIGRRETLEQYGLVG